MVTSRKSYPACLGHIGGSHIPHELVDEREDKAPLSKQRLSGDDTAQRDRSTKN